MACVWELVVLIRPLMSRCPRGETVSWGLSMMSSGFVEYCVETIADFASATETLTMDFAALNAHGV